MARSPGISIAYLGKYHGMFNFLGRLEAQVRPVGLQHPDLENWQKANPNGYLIVPVGRNTKKLHPFTPNHTEAVGLLSLVPGNLLLIPTLSVTHKFYKK